MSCTTTQRRRVCGRDDDATASVPLRVKLSLAPPLRTCLTRLNSAATGGRGCQRGRYLPWEERRSRACVCAGRGRVRSTTPLPSLAASHHPVRTVSDSFLREALEAKCGKLWAQGGVAAMAKGKGEKDAKGKDAKGAAAGDEGPDVEAEFEVLLTSKNLELAEAKAKAERLTAGLDTLRGEHSVRPYPAWLGCKEGIITRCTYGPRTQLDAAGLCSVWTIRVGLWSCHRIPCHLPRTARQPASEWLLLAQPAVSCSGHQVSTDRTSVSALTRPCSSAIPPPACCRKLLRRKPITPKP